MKAKVAIAVSGKGRSLQNFIERAENYEVAAVICSNPNAGAVTIAKEHSIPLYHFDTKALDPLSLQTWLVDHAVDWIALAGFLKIFPPLPRYRDRVINIHPALLPQYGGHGMYGHRVHEAVFHAGETKSGATIHFVNERYDEGAIIAQGEVSLVGLSHPEQIAQKVFGLECEFYPQVLTKLIQHELPLKNGQIRQYGL